MDCPALEIDKSYTLILKTSVFITLTLGFHRAPVKF